MEQMVGIVSRNVSILQQYFYYSSEDSESITVEGSENGFSILCSSIGLININPTSSTSLAWEMFKVIWELMDQKAPTVSDGS